MVPLAAWRALPAKPQAARFISLPDRYKSSPLLPYNALERGFHKRNAAANRHICIPTTVRDAAYYSTTRKILERNTNN
jgi:hypothetical protein